MRKIKIKMDQKKVKALDISGDATKRMKDAYVRTTNRDAKSSNETSPNREATDQISSNFDTITHQSISQFNKRGYHEVKRNIAKAQNHFQQAPVQMDFFNPLDMAKHGKMGNKSKLSTKNFKRIKNTRQTVKTTRKTAQSTKRTARAGTKAVSATAKIVVTAVKASITATKTLVSAIIAGGWIAVVVILIICLIGMLVGSCFGIFVSNEDSGSGITMQNVIQEINSDYQTQIDTIKENTPNDVLEMSGSCATWQEVLAVYAVKTTNDSNNPQEVATMDDSKKAILKDIFWEMNQIFSYTETKSEELITETNDGHGNIVETKTFVSRIYLYISVSHKTAEEMADKYAFTSDQREQLSNLLAEKNNSLWSQVLYGISVGNSDIVSVALSQVGNIGGSPYWRWFGFSERVEWCACFVSWCANECGYIDTGIIPKFASCDNGVQWFKDKGEWQDGSFEPSAGQIIFFDWTGDNQPNHVGIVDKCENGVVYTIEGNSSNDTCRQKQYAIGSNVIYGYGCPAY